MRSSSERASASVVGVMPGTARVQVSGRARILSTPQRTIACAPFGNRSQIAASLQVSRLVFREPSSRPRSDGLHCGRVRAGRSSGQRARRPAAGRTGSIAARSSRRRPAAGPSVVPPLSAGSIAACGRTVERLVPAGRPAAGRRAPLRPDRRRGTGHGDRRSSRRWSAGSIAARQRAVPSRGAGRSSRRWSAGSIAADVAGPSGDHRHASSRRWSAGSIAARCSAARPP